MKHYNQTMMILISVMAAVAACGPAPTIHPSPSPSPVTSPAVSATPSGTATPTATPIATVSPTATPTSTATPNPTSLPTPVPSSSASNTNILRGALAGKWENGSRHFRFFDEKIDSERESFTYDNDFSLSDGEPKDFGNTPRIYEFHLIGEPDGGKNRRGVLALYLLNTKTSNGQAAKFCSEVKTFSGPSADIGVYMELSDFSLTPQNTTCSYTGVAPVQSIWKRIPY